MIYSDQVLKDRHRELLIMAVLALLNVLAFLPSYSTLYFKWIKLAEAYGHGLLVVAIVIYMIILEAIKPKSKTYEPSWFGVFAIGITSICWFLFYAANLDILHQSALPLLLMASVWAVFGWCGLKLYAVPLAFLYFAIPVWDYANTTLVHLTVFMSQFMLGFTNITAFIDGNTVQIVHGLIVIADGCSGLKYLTAGLAIAGFSWYLNFRTKKALALLMALGLFLSLLANWIRVFLLIVIGYMSEMQSSLMHNHDYFGWIVFIVVFIPLFVISRICESKMTQVKDDLLEPAKIKYKKLPLACTLIMLLLGPLLIWVSHFRLSPEFNLAFSDQSLKMEQDITKPTWVSDMPKPYHYVREQLIFQESEIYVNINAYRKSEAGDKILPYISAMYNRSAWHSFSSEVIEVELGKGQNVKLSTVVLKKTGSNEKVLMWYWFDVGGISSANYFGAKISQIMASLRGKQYSLVVTISSACDSDCAAESNSFLVAIGQAKLDSADLISWNK